MRQIISAARCLSLALVLVAAFTILSTAQQAAAAPRSQVEDACLRNGGEFYGMWLDDPATGNPGVFTYGCFLPDGRELECFDLTPYPAVCFLNPAPEPEDNVGDLPPDTSQPAGGEVVDRYA